jgi:geranylgeranyl pyrophosphate synthase
MPLPPDELRALVESYLGELGLTPELGTLEQPMRHALGGKRVRPVLCLATGEALGADVETLLPAAAALELVHSFSLVHDDLPALDDDRERRGAPSVWAQYGEAAAILAGDALLAEAIRLGLTYRSGTVARELVGATLAMIGGQWLDVQGEAASDELHRLKTGALFSASASRPPSRLHGGRSARTSACSFRSSTTSSTATASCSTSASTAPAGWPTRPRPAPGRVSGSSTPTRRCFWASSTSSPSEPRSAD